jgi:hypothetical protein
MPFGALGMEYCGSEKMLDSRGSRDSGTIFIFVIFRFEVPRTGMQNEPTFSVQVLVLIQLQYTHILTVPDGRSRFTF